MKIWRVNVVKHFIFVGLLLTFFGFHQTVLAEVEVINNFDANIVIQKDGSILVTENITYNFGQNKRHGIFRDIPLTAVDGPHLSIDVSGVKDEVGKSYQYTASISNNILQIKIGDPNALISGVKTYVIDYQVYNTIRTFSDHDELYWNVTGNQWPTVIQKVNTSVILPDSAIPNIRMDCFTGPQGSTQKNCVFNQSGINVNYSTTQPLNVSDGFTLVLGVPLGYIQNTYVPPSQSNIATNSSTNDGSELSFFLIFVLFAVIILVIKDFFDRRASRSKPRPIIPSELKDQPVVVEYNSPNNLPPIEIGTLLDRRVDVADISSVIMDLAVRGYIKIRYTNQIIRFWPDRKDFELSRLKDGYDLVHPADKIIFKLLFSDRDKVKLGDLKEDKTTFQADIKKIEEDTKQHLRDEGYFDQIARDRFIKLEILIGAVALIGMIFIKVLREEHLININFFISLALAIIIGSKINYFIINKWLNNKLTKMGISTLAKILGFREFLQLTEKDKLQLLNAPELQPEIFEKFLPYAMVLGVEDKWAKKFEGIYNTTPKWYEDPTATSFNSYILVSNLVLFNVSFNKVFNITSTRPSSGFGGGSSGGGSGGGGGGSW